MDQGLVSCQTSIIQGRNEFSPGLVRLKKQHLDRRLFPTTRYYGSKLRLVEWLSDSLRDLHFHTVLDAFGGTGTVSLLFKMMEKDVTYNDALWSNYHIATAVLSPSNSALRSKDLHNFPATVCPKIGYIANTFKDIYYTEQENRWLDGAVSSINRKLDPQFRSDLFYSLFQACLQKRPFNIFHRKNLYLRKNCDQRTAFGNWKTWERTFEELMRRASLELERARSVKSGSTTVLIPTDASKISNNYDLVYLDPPYLKQQKNELNYEGRYHFLEGLARYDEWEYLIDTSKNNLAFKGSSAVEEWNSKKYFKDRLFDLVTKHRRSIVVLSYAENGYPEVSEILGHFKSEFKNVMVVRQNLSHALSKNKSTELLIVGA
ncbi:MAG: DNA adenine methylase [Gammaproteobacteria bacterium]|nr:DNA adenine methylase [Gammaproteobacteria bacterium]